MSALHLFHGNILRQTRSFAFVATVSICIFLGFLCVPSAADGYQVFYLGGVRGVYNSAWLGALCPLLSSILLWLPGFYLLRSQVSEDKRLKIGQIIAATPISKLRYIAGKVFSNFVFLLLLQALFTVALIAMQLIRGESLSIQIGQYLLPLAIVSLPNLLVLAALTVFFDVAPGLKGAWGNGLIFLLWTALTALSVAMPDNRFDLFGIGMILQAMLQGAKMFFPGIPDNTSFGYYPGLEATPTFEWAGVIWDSSFISARLLWIAVAIGITVLTAILFSRFKEPQRMRLERRHTARNKRRIIAASGMESVVALSPVSRGGSAGRMVAGEIRILVKGRSMWWYLVVLAAVVFGFVAPATIDMKWIVCTILPMLPVWSTMGCRETLYFTGDLLFSCCSGSVKWIAEWTAGMLVSILAGAGILFHFLAAGQMAHVAAWCAGMLFTVFLAQILGRVSGTRRFFEAVFIILFYFGPFNAMAPFDFLGVHSIQKAAIYLPVTALLFALGLFSARMRRQSR